MSNFIPFVSSSPPPIEDGQSFGWDDEDGDDFGNFASGPNIVSSSGQQVGTDDGEGFDVCWSQVGFSNDHVGGKDTQASSLDKDTSSGSNQENGASSVPEDRETNRDCNVAKSDIGGDRGGTEETVENDDFADFAAFQDDSSSKVRPPFAALNLQNTNHEDLNTQLENSDEQGSNGGALSDPVMEKSRESTATDSGVFSSDLSPLPINESCSNSEGDKAGQSEDETFTDLPQDSQQDPPSSDSYVAGTASDSESEAHKHGMLVEEEGGVCSENQSDICRTEESAGLTIPDSSHLSAQEQETNHTCNSETETSKERNGGESDDTDSFHAAFPSEKNSTDCDQLDECNQPTAVDVPGELAAGDNVLHTQACDSAGTTVAAENDADPTAASPQCVESNELETTDTLAAEDIQEDDDWAAFETSPSTPPASVIPESGDKEDSEKCPEPEDLVLRTNSVEFDEDLSDAEPKAAESEESSISASQDGEESSNRESEDFQNDESLKTEGERAESADFRDGSLPPETESGQHDEDDGFGDFRATPSSSANIVNSLIPHDQATQDQPSEGPSLTDNAVREGDDFGSFSEQQHQDQIIPDKERSESLAGTAVKEDVTDIGGDDVDDDFGDFSSQEAAIAKPNSGDTSSGAVTHDDDEDDFGDFSFQPVSSGVSAPVSNTDDFGAFSTSKGSDEQDDNGFSAFSGKSTGNGNDDVDDDFGDFSSQTRASSTSAESGWADFSASSKPDAEDDFGNFKDSKPTAVQSSMPQSDSSSMPAVSSGHMLKEENFQKALHSCFPKSSAPMPLVVEEQSSNHAAEDTEESIRPTDKDRPAILETILEYGFRYRSASQQTWQVVQHPSKKDPRVKLWSHLQDVDGSPAVVYQWGKSTTNSHLFHTLRIDTQNMLIGHKKPSVPIFATGLSLLEPIRGGGRERGMGTGVSQPAQGSPTSMLTPIPSNSTPSLVDPTLQDVPKSSQDIPAVDFDWSTSGLTNPLTSKSLDLDFLGVQDSYTSDKLSVFQSEILDAPRSSVKSSQPLEDIMKNVKPTSVRNRSRDDANMSPEAARVLAGLPDLTFMQSKVLMFPIKN